MKMERRTFRIGELTRVLSKNGPDIEPSVIRFWEKEFDISPKRSNKGQRYYDEQDLGRFIKIRELLYEKRFTIEGARQALLTTPPKNSPFVDQKNHYIKTPGLQDLKTLPTTLENLKEQLIRFKKLL